MGRDEHARFGEQQQHEGKSSSSSSRVMAVATTVRLSEPYGLAADGARRELFLSDRAAKIVYRVTLATRAEAVLEPLANFDAQPTGVTNLERPRSLAVAAGESVHHAAHPSTPTRWAC